MNKFGFLLAFIAFPADSSESGKPDVSVWFEECIARVAASNLSPNMELNCVTGAVEYCEKRPENEDTVLCLTGFGDYLGHENMRLQQIEMTPPERYSAFAKGSFERRLVRAKNTNPEDACEPSLSPSMCFAMENASKWLVWRGLARNAEIDLNEEVE